MANSATKIQRMRWGGIVAIVIVLGLAGAYGMIVIREHQEQALIEAQYEEYERRIYEEIRRVLPHRFEDVARLSPGPEASELRVVIREWRILANSHGFTEYRPVKMFVMDCLLLGEKFYEKCPGTEYWLENRQLDQSMRIGQIHGACKDEARRRELQSKYTDEAGAKNAKAATAGESEGG